MPFIQLQRPRACHNSDTKSDHDTCRLQRILIISQFCENLFVELVLHGVEHVFAVVYEQVGKTVEIVHI